MNCRERERQISKLLDGELLPSASEELARHIADCVTCSRVYESMLRLNSDLKEIQQIASVPANLKTRVQERVRAVRNRERSDATAILWRRAPIIATIIILAIGVGNLAGRSVSNLLFSEKRNSVIQTVLLDTGESLGDLLLDVAPDGNSR